MSFCKSIHPEMITKYFTKKWNSRAARTSTAMAINLVQWIFVFPTNARYTEWVLWECSGFLIKIFFKNGSSAMKLKVNNTKTRKRREGRWCLNVVYSFSYIYWNSQSTFEMSMSAVYILDLKGKVWYYKLLDWLNTTAI